MKIIIHRGIDQIGGCIKEIAKNKDNFKIKRIKKRDN